MRLIQITPAPCAHCGMGNTPSTKGADRQFVDLERDINWNDPLILCEDCCLMLGGIVGMQSPDSIEVYRVEAREATREAHDLRAKIDAIQRRAHQLGIQFTGDVVPEKTEAA